MSTKRWGVVLMVLGVIVALVSLFADVASLGAQPGVIGWKQILGVAGGLALFAVGLYLRRRGPASPVQ